RAVRWRLRSGPQHIGGGTRADPARRAARRRAAARASDRLRRAQVSRQRAGGVETDVDRAGRPRAGGRTPGARRGRAAPARGARLVRLETTRAMREAIALYRRAGYVEVQPFNDERYAHHWFEKRLTS